MRKINKNHKVLLITPLFPPYVGAAERRISDLVYTIKQFTNDIFVLSIHIDVQRPKIPNYQEKKIKNVSIFRFEIKNKWIRKLLRFKTSFNPLYIWLCFLSSLIFMLIKKSKHIFVSVPPFPFGFSVALACKLLRKRLILDLRDIPGRKGFRSSLRFIPTLSTAKLVMTVNDLIKKQIVACKSPSSVKVIPNGIDSKLIKQANKPARSPTAVFVGGASLEWYYEPEFLIKTAAFLKDMKSDINIKIIGASNPLKKVLSQSITKYDLTDHITVYSPKPIEELYDILLQSSVGIMEFSKKFKRFYAYASLVALPAKVIDYLACGLSVAYRGPNGPLARFISRNSMGAIIDTTSPEAFASCIKDAFRLRQLNPKHFEDVSKKFLDNYDQIKLFTRFLRTIFIKNDRG